MQSPKPRLLASLRLGVLAGLAGGLAEIIWIGAYGTIAGTPLDPVAQGIVASLLPDAAAAAGAAWLGVAIHMGLAVALGLALAFGVQRLRGGTVLRRAEPAIVILALAAVWAVNFLALLPRMNPDFLDLLPYSVTLVSKLLFGVAAALLLRADPGRVRAAR